MLAEHKMTRRTLLKGLSLLGVGVGLAACAPKAAPTEPPAAPKEEAKPTEPPAKPAKKEVTLRYASWWAQGDEDVIIPALEQLKDVLPHVTVEIEEGDEDKITTMMVAGTAADAILHVNQASKFYDEGLILDVQDNFDADGLDYERDFYHGLGIERWKGGLYGIPFMFNSCLMLYNKTMIQEHWGKDLWEAFPDGNMDLEDMLEIARACTKDTSGDGKIDQWGLYIFHRDYYYGMETQGWTRGDSVFDVHNMKYNFTSDIMREVAHDIFGWVQKEKICISEEEAAEINKAASVNAPFYAGKVAMRIRMSPDVGRGLQTIGDKFDWDLFYMPNYGDNLAVTRAGGHGLNIYKKTQIPDEAWQFIKFYGTAPGQTFMAQTKAGLPCVRDPEVRKVFEVGKPPHDTVLLGVVEDKGGWGDHMRSHNEGELRRIFTNELDLLYNKPYEEASRELDDVMTRVEEAMNDAIDYGEGLPFPDIKFPFKIEK